MNRLHHLKETLPQNILDNRNYPNLEFLLLDYNSSDGLEQWVKAEMKEYLDQQILVYYKTADPKYFDRSHSRNMIFKLASGDVLCNIDADNFTGTGFAEFINDVFNKDAKSIIVPDTKRNYYYLRDILGRFCAKREDFMAISGYDEMMSGYGFEDDDLYERLLNMGRKEVVIQNLQFLKAVKHDDNERIKNEFYSTNIEGFFISYVSPWKSEVLFLFKDYTYEKGMVIPNPFNTPAPVLIENLIWTKGTWRKEPNLLLLSSTDGKIEKLTSINEEEKYKVADEGLLSDRCFIKIDNKEFLSSLSMSMPMITNQGKYLYNKRNKNKINEKGFGKGIVNKNFTDKKIAI